MASKIFRCTRDASHEVAKYTLCPKFCAECGAPVEANACECGHLLTGEEKFCPRCSKPVRDKNAVAVAERVASSHADWKMGAGA